MTPDSSNFQINQGRFNPSITEPSPVFTLFFFTWTAGRQLSRITKADNTYIDYFYDDNGQLSMYKTYNADNSLDGGAEYFWEGTRLIAVRLIEDENETDGMTAFMRIIYDSNGEPLGFLLNDAMPFLYTKNILGDITGVVYYENADYLFRYAYDAYGNYELIPPDDSAAAEIMAIIFHSLNPLTYRGYVFTPAIGISHYLGSRFYVPQLCRFMNADVYYDTATGVNGTNKFAYCNNNSIAFIDPTGKNYTDGTAALQRPGEQNDPSPLGISGILVVLFNYRFLIAMLFGAIVVEPTTSPMTASTADREIKNTLQNDKYSSYWEADLSFDSSYVIIGDNINYFTALSRLRKGENIFVRSKNTAYDVTKAAARGKEPMHHNKHKTKTGYYNHYHMYGHSNDSHAWYLS